MKKNPLNKKSFLFKSCLAFGLIVLLPNSAKSQRIETATFTTFEDWCKNKDSQNEEVKHTINVLLAKVKILDCKIANEELSGTWYIELSGSKISNLLPLGSFTNLTRLDLANNQIVDIKPLRKLTKLTELGISNNRISDISPLRNMKDL
jgi:internalin A